MLDIILLNPVNLTKPGFKPEYVKIFENPGHKLKKKENLMKIDLHIIPAPALTEPYP